MTNLQRFFKIQEQLPHEQKEALENYFLGALSVLADEPAWESALAQAARMVERVHAVALDRRELECPRCAAWPCICRDVDVDFETFNSEEAE